jgi:hypothetical protein
MNIVARAAVLGLAGLTAFGAAGCNRGGGNGGTTTIIQQPGGGNAGSSPSSSSAVPASIAPINDSKELCHQIFIKTRGLSTALTSFWKMATTSPGWTYGDQKAQDAVDRVQKEAEQVFPAMDNVVGQGASSDVAVPANAYISTIKDFSNAIIEQRTDDVLNPDASKFGDAKDKLNSACDSIK